MWEREVAWNDEGKGGKDDKVTEEGKNKRKGEKLV